MDGQAISGKKFLQIAGIKKIPNMKKCGAMIERAYLQRC